MLTAGIVVMIDGLNINHEYLSRPEVLEGLMEERIGVFRGILMRTREPLEVILLSTFDRGHTCLGWNIARGEFCIVQPEMGDFNTWKKEGER